MLLWETPNTMVVLIGFQNTLVHEYIEIDRQIVYQVLQGGLADIEALIQVFAGYL